MKTILMSAIAALSMMTFTAFAEDHLDSNFAEKAASPDATPSADARFNQIKQLREVLGSNMLNATDLKAMAVLAQKLLDDDTRIMERQKEEIAQLKEQNAPPVSALPPANNASMDDMDWKQVDSIPSVEVKSVQAKVMKSEDHFVYVSWRIALHSSQSNDELFVTLDYLDSGDFKIHEEATDIKIAAGEDRTVSGQGIMTQDEWAKVSKCTVRTD